MKRKKPMKQQLLEISYNKPAVDKRIVSLKKSIGEVSSLINGKNKKS